MAHKTRNVHDDIQYVFPNDEGDGFLVGPASYSLKVFPFEEIV
jgi:hypothetical protein